MKVNLTGQTAVITGGGGILCSVIARELALAGAKTAILDLNLDAAEQTAGMIRNQGGTAIALKVNVLDQASLSEAEQIIRKTFGPIDILINGAGGNHPAATTGKEFLFPEDLGDESSQSKTFFDLDENGFKKVFDLNFMGTLLPVKVFSAGMAEQQKGVIINISSMNAFTPLTKIPAYSAAKAAVSNFTEWLAVHFSKVNIRVNAIAPGFFLTEQNRSLLTNPDGSLTPRGKTILTHTPMGRFGQPEELTGAILFLCDWEASGFVNGVVLPVDGAFHAFSGV